MMFKVNDKDRDEMTSIIGTSLWLLVLAGFLLFFIIVVAKTANASKIGETSKFGEREWQPWCETRQDLGWHFYCDPEQQKRQSIKPAPDIAAPTPDEAEKPKTAVEQIAIIRAESEELKARAILKPTPANLEAYMRKQTELTNMSSLFAANWQRVLWNNPDLDYESKHPQSNIGKKAAQAQSDKDRITLMSQLHNRYGLIYVGTAYCTICKIYGPTLRRFAGEWRLTVLAVSADGSPLSGWPEAVPDQGQLANLGMPKKIVPVTALFDKTTHDVTLLGVGFLADEDLLERIYTLLSEEVGDAY